MSDLDIHEKYFKMPNDLCEALMNSKLRLSTYEYCFLLAILRLTFGYNKKEARISTKTFRKLTGINDSSNLNRTRKKLLEKNMIVYIDREKPPTYRIQRDYTRWKVWSKQTNTVQIDHNDSLNRQQSLSNQTMKKPVTNRKQRVVHDSKDNIKDNIYKDNNNRKLWEEVLAVLKKKIPKEVYESYFKVTSGVFATDSIFFVQTPNKFISDWLRESWQKQANQALSLVSKKNMEVKFIANLREIEQYV